MRKNFKINRKIKEEEKSLKNHWRKETKKKQNLNLVIVKVGHFISVEKIHKKLYKQNVFSLNWEK